MANGFDFGVAGEDEQSSPLPSSRGFDFGQAPEPSKGFDFGDPAEPEEPTKLTREAILSNPEHMETIRKGLRTMYGDRKSFIHSDFSEMNEEELFETWQNWQRYFSVGNSVTTSKTALTAFDGDDITKQTLDENFRLFDSMESGFKSDFWDTIWDYSRGAVVDPMTIVSMGVGKALSSGGTKAANLAVKEAVKQAATSEARKAVIRAGRAQVAAAGAKEALRYSSVDIAANMAMDAAQQATRMEVGTQEDYNALQTMISGVASAGIPAILGASAASRAMSRSEWAKGTVFEAYTDELAQHDLTKEGLMKVIKKGAPRPEAQASVRNMFQDIGGESSKPVAGKYRFLHGYQGDAPKFVEDFKGVRHDSTGGTFGSKGVYLDADGKWTANDPDQMMFSVDGVSEVEVDFKNAFILTPSNLKRVVADLKPDPEVGAVSGPQIADLIKSRGHDALVVQGFDDRAKKFLEGLEVPSTQDIVKSTPTGVKYGEALSKSEKFFEDLGVAVEVGQDQVFAFNPKSIRVVRSGLKPGTKLPSTGKPLGKPAAGRLTPEAIDIITWGKAKEALPDWMAKGDRPVGDGQKTQLYFNQLFYGNKNSKGFVNYLIDEKIPFDKKLFADEKGQGGTSGFLNSTFELLDDETVSKLSKDFEESFGEVGGGLPQNVNELKAFFTENSSLAGQQLNIVSKVHQSLRANAIRGQMDNIKQLEERARKAGETYNWAQYGQGVWKRLLTSHPATTGANVLGWGQMYAMNTATDLAMGMLYLGDAALTGGRISGEGFKNALKMSKGSILSAARRGTNILQWDDTIDAANKLLEDNPMYYKALRQTRTGDAGPIGSLEGFGLEGSKVARGIEAATETAQTLTGVKLQDELTKTMSFASALDSIMLRRKGMTMAEFMRDPNFAKEMMTPEFREEIMGYAVDRALRETASRSFGDFTAGRTFIGTAATAVEKFSQAPVGGVLIPFGRFFNNTMAMAGDYSGLNMARHLVSRWRGKPVDMSTKDGMELAANAAVGWTMAAGHAAAGLDRLDKGLSWNQSERPDGSVSDRTYDWPGSAFRLLGQLWAHRIRDEEVPKELQDEALKTYVTQSLKETDSALKTAGELLKAGYSMDVESGGELLAEAFSGTVARFVSGGLRPLDPINEMVKFSKGTGEAKDRRESFNAQAFRYVDGLVGMEDGLDTRFQPIGGRTPQDPSKQMFGSRSSPKATQATNVANSLGIPLWTSVRWDGDPKLKNRLDSFFSEIVEIETEDMYERNPDFDSRSFEDRRRLFKEVLTKSKTQAQETLKNSIDNGDMVLRWYKEIAGLNKTDLKYVKEELGVEEDLIDLANDPEGWAQLELIIDQTKNREEELKRRR